MPLPLVDDGISQISSSCDDSPRRDMVGVCALPCHLVRRVSIQANTNATSRSRRQPNHLVCLPPGSLGHPPASPRHVWARRERRSLAAAPYCEGASSPTGCHCNLAKLCQPPNAQLQPLQNLEHSSLPGRPNKIIPNITSPNPTESHRPRASTLLPHWASHLHHFIP